MLIKTETSYIAIYLKVFKVLIIKIEKKLMMQLIGRNKSGLSNRKFYVILFLVMIVCYKPINANDFVEKCEQRCKDQVNHGVGQDYEDHLGVRANQNK